MHPQPEIPTRELFLVLHSLSGKITSFVSRLREFSQAPQASLLIGVDILYRADRDLALLCLRYSSRLRHAQRQDLVALACQCDVPVLDPSRLSPRDKDIFYHRHLQRYSVRVDDQKNPNMAIDALAQLLGLIDEDRTTVSEINERQAKALERTHVANQPTEMLRLQTLANQDFTSIVLGPAGRVLLSPRAGKALDPAVTIAEGPASRGKRIAVVSEENPTSLTTSSQGGVQVRFLRGERWMPARLRSAVRSEVRLAASAAPPLGTAMRLHLSTPDCEVYLRGQVIEVINTEHSVDGSTSFRIRLEEEEQPERQEQVRLAFSTFLKRARDSGLSLSPPPARKNRRFAVSWPIAIITNGQRISAEALDISRQGMFLAINTPISDHRLAFDISPGGGEEHVRGHGQIVRTVTKEMAKDRDLPHGYGIQFDPLCSGDQRLYDKFLGRIQRRSQIHVLVAGAAKDGNSLANCFEAAGYAVTQASSTRQLRDHRSLARARPHIAVIDETSLGVEYRSQFESRFSSHRVPILRMHKMAGPTSARLRLDQALAV